MPKTTESKAKKDALNALLKQQRTWATPVPRDPNYPDYTLHRDDNLFLRGLSPESQRDFESGSGGEFNRRYNKRAKTVPPKFTALKSSSALVCNVFDYWRNRGEDLLCEALNCGPREGLRMTIEAQFDNRVSIRPCNLDVALTDKDGWVLAIEGKFSEPLSRKSPLKSEYLPSEPDPTPWRTEGLVGCDKIARLIARNDVAFAYLDVPQLLKHILGLHRTLKNHLKTGTRVRDRYRLLYLYYDMGGDAGDAHRKEVEAFKRAVEHEVDFDSQTYQHFVKQLKALAKGSAHLPYFDYLETRYRLG